MEFLKPTKADVLEVVVRSYSDPAALVKATMAMMVRMTAMAMVSVIIALEKEECGLNSGRTKEGVRLKRKLQRRLFRDSRVQHSTDGLRKIA